MDSLKEIIESILFVAGEAVEFVDIADKLNVSVKDVKNAVTELKTEKEKIFSGVQVQIFNNKAQLCSNPNYAEKVSEVLNPIKEKALTKAVLEVAAIVAYKQPITRLEIEQVRGVNSDYAVNVLIENNLMEVVGRKDAIGKPLLFGTTDLFLKRFNLQDINDLPDYEDLLNRIQVIKNPENSLFDFSNIPSSTDEIKPNEIEDDNELKTEETLDNENDDSLISNDDTNIDSENLKVIETEKGLETPTEIIVFEENEGKNELEQLEESVSSTAIDDFFETLKDSQNVSFDVDLSINQDDKELEKLTEIISNSTEIELDSDLMDLV